MATTFHPFPRLPMELRLMIWEATISPRIIHTRIRTYLDDYDKHCGAVKVERERQPIVTFTPVTPPPILYACQESRNVALKSKGGYEQAMTGKMRRRYFVDSEGSLVVWSPQKIWVNFELDMFDFGSLPFRRFSDGCLLKHSMRIRRLKFELPRGEEGGFPWGRDVLRHITKWEIGGKFTQLREMCVCMPCEKFEHPYLEFPQWLLGRDDGAFLEGWRSVAWGRTCRTRDDEYSTDGNMWALVLRKIDVLEEAGSDAEPSDDEEEPEKDNAADGSF